MKIKSDHADHVASGPLKNTIISLKHYLPDQKPLKDFIHHNTLHAFQHLPFDRAMEYASTIFGYKTYLSIKEYRRLYRENKIDARIFQKIIQEQKGADQIAIWKEKLLEKSYNEEVVSRVGRMRSTWMESLRFDIDKHTFPVLFRTVGSFLDQGISIWKFPTTDRSFLNAVRELERRSFFKSFFSRRARKLFLNPRTKIDQLLKILVGDESLYERYLFDQQFSHPGWSGMASVLEDNPNALLDRRKISLSDLIFYELCLELDALDQKFGENQWKPVAECIDKSEFNALFSPVDKTELFEVYHLWQEIFEWSYYDQVLSGLQSESNSGLNQTPSVQILACIDDRICSFRRYIEEEIQHSETFGTAGFFNMDVYFQPEYGKFYTKSCPAPITPRVLIKELEAKKRHKKDWHFTKTGSGLMGGWLISQTMGFLSALRLLKNVIRPSFSPIHVSSFLHMDSKGKLVIKAKNPPEYSHELKLGFTLEEMTDRLESLLRSIGLTDQFADLIYIVGHGASSANNTHYAGYDCGACSGRAGSVNARIAATIANDKDVRNELKKRGIIIPEHTHFISALHDTTKDELEFFDEDRIPPGLLQKHIENIQNFERALMRNAKERSRRFLTSNKSRKPEKIHQRVKQRALSLFEPRPEWNHATNALCIVGRRSLTRNLFLDRRAFLNSYDYSKDPDGRYLLNTLKAVAPVCGGINLEYYFSRVDNERLGAATKLSHNVTGLIGVANGLDGDLRTGLPLQMINIHAPVRLLLVVEHYPDKILHIIQQDTHTYEWFKHQWIHLVCIQPDNRLLWLFSEETFIPYQPVHTTPSKVEHLEELFEKISDDLPIYRIK